MLDNVYPLLERISLGLDEQGEYADKLDQYVQFLREQGRYEDARRAEYLNLRVCRNEVSYEEWTEIEDIVMVMEASSRVTFDEWKSRRLVDIARSNMYLKAE